MNGEHIACVGNQAGNGGGYCAFLQKTGGTNGGVIKNLAHYITDHGYVARESCSNWGLRISR